MASYVRDISPESNNEEAQPYEMSYESTRRDSGKATERMNIDTSVKGAPITFARPVDSLKELDKIIPNPGLPRANSAPDAENPEGSDDNRKDISVLQGHVEFFDRDKTGIIYPWNTYAGMRAIGFNVLYSLAAVFVINGTFSYITLDSWIPDLRFPIYIKNIHRGKHGSDSGVYDTEGRFVPEIFEELFAKYARGKKSMNRHELMNMLSGNRNAMDLFGWTAAFLEWGTLYLLAAKDGVIPKEAIRRQYDGTLFYHIEKKGQDLLHTQSTRKTR
ncbi:hypothetical protein HK104_008311 [Borealophlyctis nickersoniae]|nr:hypothetical protein HK104_008311 [Borealophlyctis nickersoniae]